MIKPLTGYGLLKLQQTVEGKQKLRTYVKKRLSIYFKLLNISPD